MSGSLGSALVSAGGSLLGGVLGFAGQQQANSANATAASIAAANQRALTTTDNQFSAEQASLNRQFQEGQSWVQAQQNMELMADAQGYDAQQAQMQRDWSSGQAQQAMAFSADQAKQQMAFQQASQAEAERYNTEMANSAYTRATQDLKNAGLNPILAAGGQVDPAPTVQAMSGSSGSGFMGSASAPTSPLAGVSGRAGSSAQSVGVANQPYARFDSALGQAVSSAAQGANVMNGIQAATANLANTSAQTSNEIRRGAQIDATTDNIRSQTLNNLTENKSLQLKPAQVQATTDNIIARTNAIPSEVQSNITRSSANSAQAVASIAAANKDDADAYNARTFGPGGVSVPQEVGGLFTEATNAFQSTYNYLAKQFGSDKARALVNKLLQSVQ